MKYTKIYRNQLEVFKGSKEGRKALKAIFGEHNMSFSTYVNRMKELLVKDSVGSIYVAENMKLLCQELHWHESGSPIIFLESIKLAKDLYASKFDFEKDFSVAPPFKTFVMSFPENTVINDVCLKSCLVSIMPYREFIDLYGKENMKEQYFLSDKYKNNELGICVHYESTMGVMNSNFAYLNQLNETLRNNKKRPLDNNGTVMLEVQTKIALALCMYHSATNGEKLKKGYPSAAIKLPKDKSKGSYKAVTIRSFNEHHGVTGKVVTHRIPHFRNLRSERFYKKEEYKHMTLGTRWVFVKGVDVNGSANTLLN